MAKSEFARGYALGFARAALVGLALTSCGTMTGAGGGATKDAIQSASFCVAAIDGSPEEATLARGHCSSSSFYVAPIEGSPEQTVIDLGR